ncbi:MAG: ArnT family glycosyltransferase [Bryobacteraceae bacterium]
MEAFSPNRSRSSAARVSLVCLIVALACLRFCHVHLLWADEDYHLAAAIHILNGRIPFRDFWYDKPPLCAVFYLLIGGYPGWPLRILDAAYILAGCYLAYRLAREWWKSELEGYVAALLLAFFTTFYLPSAVIALAADALLIVPHFAAIYCARRKLPLWAGVWGGVAFLFNTKALFVLATCAVFLAPQLPFLVCGFALPVGAGLIAVLLSGAWDGYWEQVWHWGFIYAKGSPVLDPVTTGLTRTGNWIGFHAALVVGAVYGFVRATRNDRNQLLMWITLSFAAVCLGTRFAPHYFLQLLPPLVIAASRGIAVALRAHPKRAAVLFSALLLVPFIRFGPRYALLALDNLQHRDPNWSDVVMDLDSQRAAAKIRALAHPGETLFVWGYRPDLYVYTRMSADSRFWDSQPLTGVPADRHLSATDAIYSEPAIANRRELTQSHPAFIVDGLSPFNPKLSPSAFADLRQWMASYKLVGRTKLSLIYHRIDSQP